MVDDDNWLGNERPLLDGTTPVQWHIPSGRDCVEGEIWKPISEEGLSFLLDLLIFVFVPFVIFHCAHLSLPFNI